MKIPPKGDPMRPVALAANAARCIGTVCLLVGGFILLIVMNNVGRPLADWILPVSFAVSFLLAAAGYYVFAFYMLRKRTWAIFGAITLAGHQALWVAVGFVLLFFFGGLGGLVGFVFFSPFVAALVLLLIYIFQSLRALRQMGVDQPRGFEPIMRPQQSNDATNGDTTP